MNYLASASILILIPITFFSSHTSSNVNMDDVIDKNVPLTVFQDGYTEMRKDAHTSFGFENDADEDEAIIDFNFNNLFLDPNQTNPADDITQIYDLIAEYFFAFALVFLFIYFTLCGIVYVVTSLCIEERGAESDFEEMTFFKEELARQLKRKSTVRFESQKFDDKENEDDQV